MVGFFAHGSEGIGRSNRHGENEPARIAHAGGAERRTGSRAGSNPVIDDDGDAARDIDAGAVAKIALAPALDFGKLAVANRPEFGFIDARESNDILIANDDRSAPIDNRTHGHLRLDRHADLSHQD